MAVIAALPVIAALASHVVVIASESAACNEEQQTICKNAALSDSLSSLQNSGQCQAKPYVQYTHTCTISANYLPDMDYCCCAHSQRVMCCRYHQQGSLFRCTESVDSVATLSSVALPLEFLLPVILVPILVIVCCIVCCIRCCLRHKEDGDVFCRCTGEEDDCALTKQVPVYMPCNSSGAEEHSLLSSLPPHRTCPHSASFGHVHERGQWAGGSSLRFSSPSPLDAVGGGRVGAACRQTSCVSCHCVSHDVMPTTCTSRHRATGCGSCCHGGNGVPLCRQWSGAGGMPQLASEWSNCVCVCAGHTFTCQSSVSSGASDQCHHSLPSHPSHPSPIPQPLQHPQVMAPDMSCAKIPLLSQSDNNACVVVPSAPPALSSDDMDTTLVPLSSIFPSSPPSYDESVRMDALSTPSKQQPTSS